MPGNRSSMIDWDLAVTTGAALAGSGPSVTAVEAAAVVAELREGAERSTPLVRDFTGLAGPDDPHSIAPLLVVDRRGWVQANVDGFAEVISPLVDKLQHKKGAPGPLAESIGSRVTGAELGALLGFLGTKVLGQFDPFYSGDDATAGRLLLVAPNIVHVENELAVDPHDFRLWVCLHEETHRVQFTAVPWMRGHIHGEIASLVDSVDVDASKLAAMLGEAARRLGGIIRGDDDVTLLDLVQSPEQRAALERITAVMSLLEGHADVVMDGVGPEVIPSVAEIRRKFNQRRKGTGPLDRLLRRLLGLDAKMAQYRNGAAFVRGVLDQVGMEGFNKVWVEPENLPSGTEIGDPASWVRRVHG